MRWMNRNKPQSLGGISWAVLDRHLSYLVSSALDAGWHGQSNAGTICDMLESGVMPDFQGGGNSNAKMIREVEKLTTSDSKLGYLFSDLTDMQRLCLFAAALADGRKNEWGEAPSNAAICAMLPGYAAELRLKAPHKTLRPENFANHVAAGRSAFIKRVEQELAGRGIKLYE
ncbi:hypothetical protein ACPUEK_15965 [Marinomonas gallaica]|uniref:hypothetical protein n=1 Tax=Marinomonas gallaica TaxID=1806667 RepID=UPI003CE4A30F